MHLHHLQQAQLFTRAICFSPNQWEELEATSTHKWSDGLSSIMAYYPSHLYEASLQWSRDMLWAPEMSKIVQPLNNRPSTWDGVVMDRSSTLRFVWELRETCHGKWRLPQGFRWLKLSLSFSSPKLCSVCFPPTPVLRRSFGPGHQGIDAVFIQCSQKGMQQIGSGYL